VQDLRFRAKFLLKDAKSRMSEGTAADDPPITDERVQPHPRRMVKAQ
jgi:hypothetical protein